MSVLSKRDESRLNSLRKAKIYFFIHRDGIKKPISRADALNLITEDSVRFCLTRTLILNIRKLFAEMATH